MDEQGRLGRAGFPIAHLPTQKVLSLQSGIQFVLNYKKVLFPAPKLLGLKHIAFQLSVI